MNMRRQRLIHVDGVRLHVVEEGEGPLVLLVHGFPELWYSWRFQLPALAAAGYRAVAYDQRGYGRSSKFWDTDAYRISRLVRDAVGLVSALGERQAVIVGHDWGAPVAWTAAWQHPEIFRGVMGMSVPELAESLGVPFDTAKSRLRLATKKLRETLEARRTPSGSFPLGLEEGS